MIQENRVGRNDLERYSTPPERAVSVQLGDKGDHWGSKPVNFIWLDVLPGPAHAKRRNTKDPFRGGYCTNHKLFGTSFVRKCYDYARYSDHVDTDNTIEECS
jgi:hypothetical protein